MNFGKTVVMILVTRVFQLVSIVFFLYIRTTATIVLNFVALGISLIYELLQLWNLGLADYLADTMNYVDLLSYISGCLWINSYLYAYDLAESSLKNLGDVEEIHTLADQEATKKLRGSTKHLFMMIFWSLGVMLRGMDVCLLF